MNPRTTGILFLLAAALAAFVYLYEIRGGEARSEAEELAKRIFPGVDEDRIEVIRLTGDDGTEMRVERVEGGWRLTEPLLFPADAMVMDGMASTLAKLSSETTLDSPQPRGVYGLDDESRALRFLAAGKEHVLRLGKQTLVGSNSYVASDDDEKVHTLATYRISSLRRPLLEIRDKRILRFDSASIERVEAHWPGGGVTLARGDEGWRVVAPIQDRADGETVDDLLSDLSFLLAEGFIDDPPPDAEVGLDHPAFEVELTAVETDGAEGPRFRLAIGDEVGNDSRVARGRLASLYRIDPDRLKDFPRKLSAYRFKELARFVATDAAKLEMVFHPPQGAPVTVVGERREDGWQTTPEAMEPGKVSRMVAELSRLRADEILADAMGPEEHKGLGLAPPRVTIRVLGGASGGEPPLLAEIHLGDVDPEQGVIARAEGDDRVYRIGYVLAEYIPVSLDAFRNRFRVEAEEEEEGEPLMSEDILDEVQEAP